jgi:hypothetical protein
MIKPGEASLAQLVFCRTLSFDESGGPSAPMQSGRKGKQVAALQNGLGRARVAVFSCDAGALETLEND